MIGTLIAVIFFVIIIGACCCSNNDNSSGSSANRTVYTQRRNTNTNYGGNRYDECPCCGAYGYDGYCSECGYPNNQGWIGENY